MKTFRRVLLPLACAMLPLVAARAQKPVEQTEKPWPRVGFVEASDKAPRLVVAISNAGDGSNRLFLSEQIGKVWIVQNGNLSTEPFLDLGNRTYARAGGEQGLLSIAFPPDYKTKGYFYASYIKMNNARDNGVSTISRFKVDPKDPNKALVDSEQVLFQEPQPFSNHNGGQLQFGKDGMLYFGFGDGGAQNDPGNRAQNLKEYMGKIIRIDTEGKPDEGKAYRVPTDNPFVKDPNARPEIWALGLRNPWRFSFDPANGDLYIGNVGQDLFEQIYWAPGTSKGGENYGWSMVEGTHPKKPDQPSGTTYPVTFPVAEFSHSAPQLFKSITGGYVYRGSEFPAWQGVYFFGDHTNNQIWAMRRNAENQWETHQVDAGKSPLLGEPTYGVDEKGNVYVASYGQNYVTRVSGEPKIYKLVERPAGEE